MYDLIIIGAGPAGIAAAIYAARRRMNFLIISSDIGGQAALSGKVENYIGYQFINGPELVLKFEEHMREYDIKLKEGEKVLEMNKKDNGIIIIKTNKNIYETKTVIIASGKKAKELNVEGEKEFKNKGLTYCAICDGPLFGGKDIAIIGGGNSALDAAVQMVNIAKHIYIINIGSELTGDAIIKEKIDENKKVSILNNTQVTAIVGNKFVSGIKIKRNGEEETLSVEGVFVEIGLIPSSEFAKGLNKNEKGEIKINCASQTNIEGIFAAGDVTEIPDKQIIIAAGEGAKAALSAFRYLAHHR